MGKLIKTGDLPEIGKRETANVWTIQIKINRAELEGLVLKDIIALIESKAGPKINTVIAQAKNKADQWAKETKDARKFLKFEQ